jgi:hypothetical protein
MARRQHKLLVGRIRPYERDADDSAAILGASIPVQDVHSQEVWNMEQRGLDLKTKRNYRNRVREIYTFFKSHYPDYYTVGVRQLSEEERTNPDSFYWKNLHDLIYTCINVSMVKAFMAHKKVKANGNTLSHVQLCKYNDALLWGSQEVKQLLPRSYYREVDKFLQSFRKETVDAKKEENLTSKKRILFQSLSSS